MTDVNTELGAATGTGAAETAGTGAVTPAADAAAEKAAAAKAKAEKAAAAKAKAEKAAAEKAEMDPGPPERKMVKIKLHKDRHTYADVFVSVNGERWLIQRGVEVEVPDYIEEAIRHSISADEEAMRRREAMAAKLNG